MRNLVFNSCKTTQIYLVRDNRIMTQDSNQNLIFHSKFTQANLIIVIEICCLY